MSKINPNDPALPTTKKWSDHSKSIIDCADLGLTIRAELAARAMQGFAANRWTMERGSYSDSDIAKMSVALADALIEELNK